MKQRGGKPITHKLATNHCDQVSIICDVFVCFHCYETNSFMWFLYVTADYYRFQKMQYC